MVDCITCKSFKWVNPPYNGHCVKRLKPLIQPVLRCDDYEYKGKVK